MFRYKQLQYQVCLVPNKHKEASRSLVNFWFVFQTETEFRFVLDSPTWDQIFSNFGSRRHLSVAPNDCGGRSGAWEGRLCVDYRPRPQERAALDFDICQTKPGQWDFYPFMLWSCNCVKSRYSTFPPPKKKSFGHRYRPRTVWAAC